MAALSRAGDSPEPREHIMVSTVKMMALEVKGMSVYATISTKREQRARVRSKEMELRAFDRVTFETGWDVFDTVEFGSGSG